MKTKHAISTVLPYGAGSIGQGPVLYVDPGFANVVNPTGAIDSPFTLLQDAINVTEQFYNVPWIIKLPSGQITEDIVFHGLVLGGQRLVTIQCDADFCFIDGNVTYTNSTGNNELFVFHNVGFTGSTFTADSAGLTTGGATFQFSSDCLPFAGMQNNVDFTAFLSQSVFFTNNFTISGDVDMPNGAIFVFNGFTTSDNLNLAAFGQNGGICSFDNCTVTAQPFPFAFTNVEFLPFGSLVFTGPTGSFLADNLSHSTFVSAGGTFTNGDEYFPLEGGLVAPLSREFYVDVNQTPVLPDGSIGSPFSTLQDGISAVDNSAAPDDRWLIHTGPSDTSENLLFDAIPGGLERNLEVHSDGIITENTGDITWFEDSGGSSNLVLHNQINDGAITIDDDSSGTTFTLLITGDVLGWANFSGTLDAINNANGFIGFQNTGSDMDITAPNFAVVFKTCFVSGVIAAGDVSMSDCFCTASAITLGGSTFGFTNTIFANSCVITGSGAITFDNFSYQAFLLAGGTFAGGASAFVFDAAGSGAVPPLGFVMFVDGNSTATLPDGSIGAAFDNIPDAIAAADVIALGAPWTFYLAPNDYSDNITIPNDGTARNYTFVSPMSETIISGDIDWTDGSGDVPRMEFHNVSYDSGATMTIDDNGASTDFELIIGFDSIGKGVWDGDIDGSAVTTGTGALIYNNTEFGGDINAAKFQMLGFTSVTFGGTFSVEGFGGSNLGVASNITVTGPSNFFPLQSSIFQAITWTGPAGSFVADDATFSAFYESGATFAGGATHTQTQLCLPLRVTTTERSALSTFEGLEVFDTTLHTPFYFDGTNWIQE